MVHGIPTAWPRPMTAEDLPIPETVTTTLPDGTAVRVEAHIVPDHGSGVLDSFRYLWLVRAADDPTGSGSAWRAPLAVDYTPELALEEAWYETLVQRGHHLRANATMPPRQRYLAIEVELTMTRRTVRRATWSRLFTTLPEAREGFELESARRRSVGGSVGPLHLMDRKDRRMLDTTLPLGVDSDKDSILIQAWVRPRRGKWTEEGDALPESPAIAGAGVDFCGRLLPVPPGIQAALDRVTAWAHGGTASWVALRRVTAYLEQEGLIDAGNCFEALPPRVLPSVGRLSEFVSDDDVRTRLGLGTHEALSESHRLRYFADVVVPSLLSSEKAVPLGQVRVVSSDGNSALIPFTMDGAMMSTEVQYEWFQPARDQAHMASTLEAMRWIVDVDRWRAMTPTQQRRFFGR